MNILGPDDLIFGVDDLDACRTYLLDYGLTDAGGDRYEALDGTAIVLRQKSDASLPPDMGTSSMLRETVYGVADEKTLDAIEAEMRRDREVSRRDGVVRCCDDMGFALAFQITIRKPLNLPAEPVNAPGATPQRQVNVIGVTNDKPTALRTLSHVVYFVPDSDKAELFYHRLGFICTDRFTGVGPFLRPAGTLDHHTLFMIEAPAFMKGCEHFTFHMGGPTDVLLAGHRFEAKGYETFWGPGRHLYGSNWFWYFNSPLGCHVEYDADMDQHDENWTPREVAMNGNTAQSFLFRFREKWAPVDGLPPNAKRQAAEH